MPTAETSSEADGQHIKRERDTTGGFRTLGSVTLVAGALALGLAAAPAKAQDKWLAPAEAKSLKPAKGARPSASAAKGVYKTDCAACHRASGRGGAGAPDLTKTLAAVPPIAIAAAMWNHGFAMEQVARARGLAWPYLDGRDLADMAAFLRAAPRTR